MEINVGDTIMIITETHVLVVNVQSAKLRKDFTDQGASAVAQVSTICELERA